MKHIDEFVDDRQKAWCIHCGNGLAGLVTNRDHVPSKCLLDKPYPAALPVTEVCRDCNNGFSRDEEYLVAFLGAVLAGSTDPVLQTIPRSANILRRNHKLRERIARAQTTFTTRGGETRMLWKPEQERVDNVLLKNARGHALFEYGEPMLEPPDRIWSAALETLGPAERATFENATDGALWPEVGSQMLTRVVTGHDLQDGWVIVQDGVYRYAVLQDGLMTVRMVIREYLAAEVTWDG